MEKDIIVKEYNSGKSMRQIALMFNTNHKLISRILKGENIETRKPKNTRGKKKFNCEAERLYHNMATHLRFDIDHKWLMQFKDINKLKILNEAITNRDNRWSDIDSLWYRNYICKFYNDSQFNRVYLNWINSDYEAYKKPSIDHIVPKSKGGTNELENLQFLTWFENRCKNNMTQNEWNKLKSKIGEYFE